LRFLPVQAEQGSYKSIKHRALLRGQEVEIAFVVEEEGGDSDDRFGQVSCSGNALSDFFRSFADQIAELGWIDLHFVKFSVGLRVAFEWPTGPWSDLRFRIATIAQLG
jgi:hypothetical protein